MKLADYIAAGQDRGTAAVFLSLMATMLGASATIGVAARAESMGFAASWWLLAGAAGLALQGVLLSGKIRDTGAKTLPEMAGLVAGPWARRLVAGVVAVSWPGVIGAQFAAFGGLCEAVAGSGGGGWAVAGCAAVVVGYSLAGGQRAVVRTDAWQAGLLAAGFGGLFFWVFSGRCGGEMPGWEAIRPFSEGFGVREAVLTGMTVGGAYFLGPDIASRSLVAKDGRTARRAVLWGAPALAAFGVAVALAGMWAGANAPGEGNPVYRIAARLPWGIRWCVAVGLFAALGSSADTCLVNAGAIAANDLLGCRSVRATRWEVAAMGAAGLGLALWGKDIIGLLLLAYSVYTPGVAGPLAVAIVAGRAGRRGWWHAAVAAGGICGVAGAVWPGGAWWPVAGMGVSVALAVAGVVGDAGIDKRGAGGEKGEERNGRWQTG